MGLAARAFPLPVPVVMLHHQAPIFLTGPIAPIAGSDTLSGIAKVPVERPLRLDFGGFEGDAQADRRVHGGPEKALHHYAFDHYATWFSNLGPGKALAAGAGAFGENISTVGTTEEDVAVGDIFRLGSALVQISQGRQPCWKLDLRFERRGMGRMVQQSGRTGWYYRVLETGIVRPDDQIKLVERVAPEWTIRKLWHAMYVDRLNRDMLTQIAELNVLAEGWRKYAQRRLDSGRVEDWTARLEGSS